MVKYIISTLHAMVGAKPTGSIKNIHERPNFSTLFHLQRQIVDSLRKVGNVKFFLEIHTGYILSKEALPLLLSEEWRDPEEVGEYYEINVTAITETEQQIEENKWK